MGWIGAVVVFGAFGLLLLLGYAMSRITPGVSAGLRVGGAGMLSGSRQQDSGGRLPLADRHLLVVAVLVAISGLGVMVGGGVAMLGVEEGFVGGVSLIFVGGVVVVAGIGLVVAGPRGRAVSRICALGMGILLAAIFPIGTALGIYISWTLALRKEAGAYFMRG